MKRTFLILVSFFLTFILAIQSSAEIKSIDGIMYKIGVDNSAVEKYTGWATSKSTGNKYYYKNGKYLTGVQVTKSSRYVFDENGIFLLKRTNSKEKYSVVFDNDYNVEIEDGKISFNININDYGNKSNLDFDADPYFSLYIYKDRKWKAIKYTDDGFDAYGIIADESMFINFSKNLSDFDYKFEPGLYRVKTQVGDGERNKNGEPVDIYVRGEFNLV